MERIKNLNEQIEDEMKKSEKLLLNILPHSIAERLKKGENIISLDLKKVHEAAADFFIICEANNTTQLKAIADFIDYEVKSKCGELPYKTEGKQGGQWLLIDYINVVVHIMHPEARGFYKLEELWSDADAKTHED